MAKVARNLVLHGASGKLGDQIVIRQWKGQTVLSVAPPKQEGGPTEAQKKQRQRFQQAIIYAKKAIADEEQKKAYEAKAEGTSRSAYNVAVADFLHAPDIDEVDVSAYTGAAGDPIRVRVTDDFAVTQVWVAIYNSDGALVEEGAAVQQDNQIDWVYTATQSNPDTGGDRILIRASDLPGNLSEQEKTL